ncbi:MAG: YfhO family protein [Chloroflexi bacterium]|nr:YfhO family protein [Chloroflexota bacterium]
MSGYPPDPHTRPYWPVVVLTLAVLTLCYFAPVLLQSDQSLAGADFREIHYPLLKFVVDTVHEDQTLPLWNPHQFLGYSVVGNPQYGLFYPPNWLLLLFRGQDIYHGVALLVGLHFFWLGLGGAVLARRYGANAVGALLAGAMLGLGGLAAARLYAGHYAVLLTLAWVPWIMAGFRLAAQRRPPIWAMPGALALGLAIMAGHPQFAYIAGLGLSLQWIYEIASEHDNATRLVITRHLVVLVILGLALSAITWLPAWDYQAKTLRGATPDSVDFANQHAVPLEQLSTLFVPNLFGMPLADTGYWGKPFYEEMTAYSGILAWLALALLWRLQRRLFWFFGGIVLFSVVVSLGADAVLYRLLYWLVPPARDFRAPGRILVLGSVALSIATAIALTSLMRCSALERRAHVHAIIKWIGLPGVTVLLFATGVYSLFPESVHADGGQAEYIADQLLYSTVILGAMVIILWLWTSRRNDLGNLMIFVLILITLGDLWRIAGPLRNTDAISLSAIWQHSDEFIPSLDNGEYGRTMQMSAPPGIVNGASWTRHLSAQGYDPVVPAGWARLREATGQFILDPGSAVNRVFGVHFALSGQPLGNYGFYSARFYKEIGSHGPYRYYQNTDPLPRAYIAQGYAVEPDLDAGRTRITNNEFVSVRAVLLSEAPNCVVSGEGGTAEITTYRPNDVTITVQADGPGLLVLTDQYDDDWVASVDGQETRILRANTTVRAVCVPAGEHQVVFSYRPWSLRMGAVFSSITWLFFACTGAGIIVNKGRSGLGPDS